MRRTILYLLFIFSGLLLSCKRSNFPHAGIGVIYPPTGAFLETGDSLLFENRSYGTRVLWNFGDGTTSTSSSQNIKYAYSSAGTYSVTLTAYDQDGNSNQAVVNIIIHPAFGNASFWFSGSPSYGTTLVTVATLSDTIKVTTGPPGNCGLAGWANFQLAPGIYGYSAVESAPGTHTWAGVITITTHGCLKQQLF